MKLVEHFGNFLNNTVNLNQTRIDTLEARVEVVKDFIRGSDYRAVVRGFSAQGSWAHKTIIKPQGENDEFDADLVVYVNESEAASPKDYILDLRRIFKSSGRYSSLVGMKKRCVTINYAGDFHLDVVPIVVKIDIWGNISFLVCNRSEDIFEATDGDGFASWWSGQNAITTKNNLIKAARLIKYLRDTKNTFSAKSVLLTTLIGSQIVPADRLYAATYFTDVPTTLKTVINRLDDWLQARATLPRIENPSLPGESFTRNWTEGQYQNFRNRINQYRKWIDDAYLEAERDASIRKWRRLFGDDFAKGEVVDRATTALAALAESCQRGRDLVAAVLAGGRELLARIPTNLPHVQDPPYQLSNQIQPVRIVAFEKPRSTSPRGRQITTGDPVVAGSGIEFHAVTSTGLPFPETFQVHWQVVNTGDSAARANCLRGGFYRSETGGYRHEETKYRGVHWVKAFVVNKRTGLIVGVSERFFVVIP